MKANLILLPGDGIGPEVIAEAARVLEAVARGFGHQITYSERLLGGCLIDRHGVALTDEASVLAGSMGLLPSASLGAGGPGVHEPIHGSAPDIAGRRLANPIGAILSAALLLRHSLQLEAEAALVEAAVDAVLADGARTADLGGTLGTRQMTDAILRRLAERLPVAA